MHFCTKNTHIEHWWRDYYKDFLWYDNIIVTASLQCLLSKLFFWESVQVHCRCFHFHFVALFVSTLQQITAQRNAKIMCHSTNEFEGCVSLCTSLGVKYWWIDIYTRRVASTVSTLNLHVIMLCICFHNNISHIYFLICSSLTF